ncbi:MAG: hypothetical protein UE295_00490 [Acutalibacteraceae bacterium]|nr:hypothetical protein [Acutalibacteraceae bacterium]
MQKITSITDQPKQELLVRLKGQNVIVLKLEYISQQIGWFLSYEYEGKISNCHRITNCYNILREAQNTLPFGIACTVTDGQEPYFLDDFKEGRANLYILSKDEVEYVEKTYYGKIF